MSNDRIRINLTQEEVRFLRVILRDDDGSVVRSVYKRLDPDVDAILLELTPRQLWALAEAMPESATGIAIVERVYAESNRLTRRGRSPGWLRLPAVLVFLLVCYVLVSVLWG